MKKIVKSVFVAAILSLSISSCSVYDQKGHLESVLEEEQSDLAKIEVSSVIPKSEKIAIVCPYSGDKVNDEFRDSVFKGYEAEHEGNNWIVLEKSDGAIVKEEFYRAEIDMCTIGFDGFSYVSPDDVLVFERNAYTWILSDIERKDF